MLAKIWKKVLLAICIVACLYNVISKIVNRNSLEINLRSVNDGNTIWDAVKTKNETVTNSDKIEGVKESYSNSSNENKVNRVNREKISENQFDNNSSDYTIIINEE